MRGAKKVNCPARPIKHVQTLTENRYSSKNFHAITFGRNSEARSCEANLNIFLRFGDTCVRRASKFRGNREHIEARDDRLALSMRGDHQLGARPRYGGKSSKTQRSLPLWVRLWPVHNIFRLTGNTILVHIAVRHAT